LNLRDIDGGTALIIASEFSDTSGKEIVEALISAGADLNIQNKDGYTALMTATFYHNQETVDALISAGADLNIQDEDGETALMLATKESNYSTADALILAGAIVHEKTIVSKQLLAELLEYKKRYGDLVRDMQIYAPDGEGAREAESHFNSLV
jgi:ankyrin repeat protein